MSRTEEPTQPVEPEGILRRANLLFAEHLQSSRAQTDRMFAALLLTQWVAAVLIAAVYSPFAWAGKASAVHLHVQLAVGLGLLINSVPLLLIQLQPGKPMTRYVIAAAQMLWGALLIHLTGGRIETHFHVFGSLAFLAFYRDWKVLVPATVVVATDHVVRQFLYPESVYGIANPEWWRFIEHAFWVVFEDSVLVYACIRGVVEVKDISDRTAQLEALRETERQKSRRLDEAIGELRRSQETLVRTEKLAAVGQLAASVGHELRNPLAAVQNAHTYMNKRLAAQIQGDPRLKQFSEIIDKELAASTRIISDLLDFARDREPTRGPCPLRSLVADAVAIVPKADGVTITNDVPEGLPVPSLDRDQIRQVLVNLVQNACEAMAETGGTVRVSAEGGDEHPWILRIVDQGPGMDAEVMSRVFQPLFTTKTKGTGLGLAIVSSIVQRHDGTIRVDSEPGRGTTFVIELPALPVATVA